MQQDRTASGKFAAGNKLSRGNPHCDRIAKLRSAMLAAVTEKNMKAVIKKLIELAEGGDVKAIQLLLDRTLGKIDAQILQVSSQSQPDSERRAKTMALIARIQEQSNLNCREDTGSVIANVPTKRTMEAG